VLRAFLQKSRELLPILVGEALFRAGMDAAAERLLAPLAGPAHPLADGSVRYPKGLGNVGLLPPFLFELKRSKTPFFLPISRVGSHEHLVF
jgi:hypothetical protein